jgi:curved DNA-binding protein CbpA
MTEDPYVVLGIGADADEGQIRQRYLQLVREHPPERDPQGFASVRAAYDQVRDPVVSLKRRLFDLTATDGIDQLISAQMQQNKTKRIPTELLLSLGDK